MYAYSLSVGVCMRPEARGMRGGGGAPNSGSLALFISLSLSLSFTLHPLRDLLH